MGLPEDPAPGTPKRSFCTLSSGPLSLTCQVYPGASFPSSLRSLTYPFLRCALPAFLHPFLPLFLRTRYTPADPPIGRGRTFLLCLIQRAHLTLFCSLRGRAIPRPPSSPWAPALVPLYPLRGSRHDPAPSPHPWEPLVRSPRLHPSPGCRSCFTGTPYVRVPSLTPFWCFLH